ncbi:hypothetical protein N0V85_001877 [Neurospora sp. IMI 360204]|nr:hypothetical protein N0V85_001877 [Neurospora sp. IMI 360204]
MGRFLDYWMSVEYPRLPPMFTMLTVARDLLYVLIIDGHRAKQYRMAIQSWGSCLSLCLLAINYIAGTSALPKVYVVGYPNPAAVEEWDTHPHLYGHHGNFTGSCTDVKFDDNQCVLSARCRDVHGKEPESKLNLNKCVYYSTPDPPGTRTYTKGPFLASFTYSYEEKKVDEALDQRFRPGSFCDKATCESCRIQNADDDWDFPGLPGKPNYLVCMCRDKVDDPKTSTKLTLMCE